MENFLKRDIHKYQHYVLGRKYAINFHIWKIFVLPVECPRVTFYV